MEVDIPDVALPQLDTRTFRVKGTGQRIITVVVRQAFGSDLVHTERSGSTKLTKTEQLYALMARVTSFDGVPAKVSDFTQLPLGAITRITKEFNILNGEDPLEDIAESTGE